MPQNLSWLLDKIADVPQATTELIDLSPGNDTGIWTSLKNIRLQKDREYSFWKLRGGTESFTTFEANIISAKGFEARVGGVFKKYIVVQVANGKVFLRNLTDATTTTIADGGNVVSTSVQADFVVIGQFLYIFSYAATKFLAYNLENGTLRNWLGVTSRPISSYAWVTGEIVPPNIWGHDNADDIFVPPFDSVSIYRSYAVVDVLEDGSVAVPGRPVIVQTLVRSIVNGSSSRIGVNLTMPPKQTGVAKRVLVASRWRPTAELTTQPTSEEYPNGPYFIVSDIADPTEVSTQITIQDRTPDNSLIRPLIELVPMVGGVPIIYGPNQLRPRKASGLKGSMIIGGFDVVRPVPGTSGGTPNVRINVGSGTDTSTPSYVAAVMFEYTNGQKSSIVDGSVILKRFTSTPGVGASGRITVNANTLDVSDIAIVSITFDGQFVETAPIRSSFSKLRVAELIMIALSGSVSLSNKWIFEVVDVTDPYVNVTSIELGTINNGLDFGIAITADDPTDIDLSVLSTAGGSNYTEGGSNAVIISGLNVLVSSVYFLAKNTSTNAYYLINQVNIGSGYAHGCPYLIKLTQAQFDALPSFPVPEASTSPISFRNFISLAIPAQNPRIDSQNRTVDNSAIQGLIPMRYDSDDKSVLRYQIIVLTDQNVQVGYLTEISRQPLNTFLLDLEIIDPSVKAINSFGFARIQDAVVFQSNAGISVVEGRSVRLLIDRHRYPVIESGMTSVAFNKDYNEIWMFFANQSTVLVYDKEANTINEFVFGTQELRFGLYNDNKMLIAIAGELFHTDKPSVFTEFSGNITGSATTDYLTRITERMKMLELSVYGQNIDVGGFIDLQTSRRESINDNWVKTFTNDVTLTPASARMHGVSFQIHRRGIKPRLLLNFTNNNAGYIEDIRLKVEINENTGRARL